MDGTALSVQASTKYESLNSTSASTLPDTNFLPYFTARTIACALFSIYLAYRYFRYSTSALPPVRSGLKALPGPTSTLPYLGRVHDVDRMQAWVAMKRFSDQFDGLFALTLGGETHIWVAREDVAQDLLVKNAAISSARADLGAYPGVTQGHRYLPLLGYTKAFHRQKRFAHSMMTRNVANNYYGYIELETKRLMCELTDNPKDWWMIVHTHCARISSQLAYGSPDLAHAHVTNAGKFINQLGPSGPAPNLAPFLIHLPEWLVPGKRDVRTRQEGEAKLWTESFEQAKKTTTQELYRNTYVSASLEAKASGENGARLFENEEEAHCAVGMLCTVGVFTIAGPAAVFVMAMILHDEWQVKIRAQIDEIVGNGIVELEHSPRLPMLRAAIKECLRWKSTVPLGVPRLLAADYEYDGYHFPKGAVVHVLDIAISQDPNRYDEPAVYNPDRWLNETSPNYRAPLTEHPRLKGHHIFGRGKRACPGQDLAEAELLVMCGNLLRFFTLGPATDDKGTQVWPDPDKWTSDVIGGPLPFDCEIKIRGSEELQEVAGFRKAFFSD